MKPVRLFYTPLPSRDNLKPLRVDFGSMPQEKGDFQQLFDQALSAQQQKNGDEALKLYQEALDKSPNQLTAPQSSVIYHNMSAIAFDRADFLHAYVWSKKALVFDPGNRTAQQALEQYSKKFIPPKVSYQLSSTQNLQRILGRIPIDVFFVLGIILFFVTLRLIFKNLILKRHRQVEFTGPSSFAWKPWISAVLLALTLAATAVRWDGEQKTVAIVMTDKTSVQTAPGEDKSSITSTDAGTEVQLLQVAENYAQIRYPGAFTGWVPKKNLEILSKRVF